jgi:antiviral defense system Shedu protein SduA
MQIVHTSRRGIDYLASVLRETKLTVTRATFWRIPHKTTGREDIHLKIGRYNWPKLLGIRETPEVADPKSELTLDDEEFKNLIRFLEENYEAFRAGERRYVPINATDLRPNDISQLRRLFEIPDTPAVARFVLENDLLPRDVLASLEYRTRQRALREFEDMIRKDLVEHDWQKWFKTNDWVFGTDFVRIVDEREIDTANIADYLVEAYDGFLDIVEIKRPEGGLRFWAEKRDHGNLVPSSHLVNAVTQTTRYLFEVEQEANNVKFLDRIGVRAVKPRATLIFGRSGDWGLDEREAYRILNRSLHDVTILTYDHVLDRAQRILAAKEPEPDEPGVPPPSDDDIPF